MRYSLLIPKNLDLEELIDEHLEGFENKSGVTKHSLAYICDCIIYRSITHREKIFKHNRYVLLTAQYLKNIIPQYQHSVEFLIKNKIIECDGHKIPHVKPYGYRLCVKYLGKGWKSIPVGGTVKRKLIEREALLSIEDPKPDTIEQKRKKLYGILQSPLLKIDANAAKEEIRKTYRGAAFLKIKEDQGENFDDEDAIDLIEQTVDNFHNQIDNINSNDRRQPSIDRKGYRLHSTITNLPKFLRKYLSYDGKSLISLDLKNSQPYFSLLLLQEKFYRETKRTFSLSQIDGELFKLLQSKDNNPIIMQEILETIANTEEATFKNYIEDAEKGNIYDRFMDVQKGEPYYDELRNDIKERFFQIIYGRKSTRGKDFYKAYTVPFRVFDLIKSVKTGEMKHIPNPAKIYEHLKPIGKLANGQPVCANKLPNEFAGVLEQNKPIPAHISIDKGYAKLATTLQRIESYLLLDVVCLSLLKEHPQIPIITVHDSIATTEEYVETVDTKVMEVLSKAVGFKPKLEVEQWK